MHTFFDLFLTYLVGFDKKHLLSTGYARKEYLINISKSINIAENVSNVLQSNSGK